MEMATVLLFCVSMTMVLTENGSVVDTGVDQHWYQINTNCSLYVSASEVEQYHRVKEMATKLVYVQFKYNGTQWDVIKVLDEKSKYLLPLGDYATYVIFSLYTLSFGIEHTSITLNMCPQQCLNDSTVPISLSMMLVSDDFKTVCEDRKCLEDLYATRTVCVKRQEHVPICTVFNGRDKPLMEVLHIPYAISFYIVLFLFYVVITDAVITVSRRFLKNNFIYMLLHSKRIMYTLSDFDDISIVENNSYLIDEQSVPCGILPILFDIYVPHFFPSVDLLFKSKAPVKSSSSNISKESIWETLLCVLAMYLLYVIVTRSDLSFMCFLFIYLFLSISLLIKICLRPPTITIDSINPGSILYGFKDCSFIVLMLLSILALPFISFYNAFQLIARYKRYRALFGPTYRNCRGNIKAWSDLFAWLFFCTVIAWMTYCVIVLTLIGITTNSVPYLPLVMASIVYWVKISARLSNWYRVFFETILEKVMSMIEKHSLEIMLQSRKNCFLVVRSRSPLQIQGDRLQVSGIPIFIDREGTLKLTKAFFHRCLKIRNERSHNNSFRTSSDAVRQLINVNIFLFIIALIIMSFGVVGELSTSYLTLVSLAGGVLPFLFDNFIIKDSSVSDIGADIILKHDLEYLVNSYEESFEIDGYPQTEQSILVSNGYELTTVRSHLSPDGQELSTVPSDSTTENITEVGDISEMNPLLSLNTCRDVKVRIQIEDDGQERKTEVQGDPSFIDIK